MATPFQTGALAALFVGFAGAVPALTLDIGTRSILVELAANDGTTQVASDFETVFDTPYVENLAASIGGNGYNADVGMNAPGFFGIDAFSILSGRLTTTVDVLESYVNETALPVDLSTSFIVVDGGMFLEAGANSTLTYSLRVGSFPFTEFDGTGTLTGGPGFRATFSSSGDSLGATQAAPGSPVSFPFSVNTLDLGRIQPGEGFIYTYSLKIELDAAALEGAFWRFLDPSAHSPLPSAYVLTATPVDPDPPAIPLPASISFLALGLASLTAVSRRRA